MFRKLLLGVLASFLALTTAQGATLSWDPTNSGGTALGGATTNEATEWKTGSGNLWWDIAAAANVPWTNSNDATFGGTAGTVYLGSAVSAGALSFATTGYTINLRDFTTTGTGYNLAVTGISGSAATITNTSTSGTQSFTVNVASGTTTWGGTISGQRVNFVKSGAGTLVFANGSFNTGATFTGDSVAVNGGGTLQLSGSITTNQTSYGLTVSGSTFDLNGLSLASTKTITSAAGTILTSSTGTPTITFNYGGGGGTMAGSITGTLALSFSTNLTATLSGANTFSGGVSVPISGNDNPQTLNADSDSAFGTGLLNMNNNQAIKTTTINFRSASPGIGGLASSGTGGKAIVLGTTGVNTILSIGSLNTSTTFGGVISQFAGTIGGITKTGTGTLTLTGTNTYSGTTTINGGALSVATIGDGSVAGNLGQAASDATNLVLNNGTLRYTGATASTNRNFTITGGATGTFDVTSNNLTLAGAAAATTGALAKIGAGTLTLTGANAYTGTTTVNGGTLVVDTATNPTILDSTSSLTVGGAAANSTFQLKGLAATDRTQVLNGLTVAAGLNVLDVNNPDPGTSTTLDLRGVSTTAGISRNANGFVDFRASTGTFGADAVVKTGQANNPAGILGAWATVGGGAAFAANDGTGKIVAYTGYANIDALGPNTIADGTTTNVRINSLGTSGSVGLAAETTNINTLTQNFTTASTIDTADKTLRLGTVGGIFITTGNAALTIGTAAGSGTLTAGGDATDVAGELILGNNSASALTLNANVTNNGAGTVSLTACGPATLAGTNTYTGATTVNAGILKAGSTSAFGSGSAVTLINATGVALDITGYNNSIGSLAGGGATGGNVTLGAATLTVGGDGTSTSYNGVIAGTGALTKTGAGTLTIGGNNTYTGTTTVSQGTLALGASDRINNANTVTVNASGTFDLAGFNETIKSIGGTGSLTNSVGALSTLTLGNGVATSSTFDGIVSGNLKINWSPTNGSNNVLTLTNPGNTYSGGTQLTFGSVAVGDNAALGSGAITVGSNARVTTGIRSSNTTARTIANSLSLGGNDRMGMEFGSSTPGLNGDLTFTAASSIGARSWDFTIYNNTTLTNTLSGSRLRKLGAGTLLLPGSNSFTGGLSIDAGTVVANSLANVSSNRGALRFHRCYAAVASGHAKALFVRTCQCFDL